MGTKILSDQEIEKLEFNARGSSELRDALQAVKASHETLRAELARVELSYRRLLWLGHGHEIAALYGDDGEMQCAMCNTTWDYKRAPLAEVEEAAERAKLARVAEALAEGQGDPRS